MWKWLKRIIDYPRLDAENAQLRADLQVNSDHLIQLNNERSRHITHYQEQATGLAILLSQRKEKLREVSPGDPLVAWATRYSDGHLHPVPNLSEHTLPFTGQLKTLWTDIRKEIEEKKECGPE